MAEELHITKKEKFLDVGLIIFLQPKGTNKNIRYKSLVVGWKADIAIIIETPILNGAFINLYRGCNCIIRYLYRGEAFGFETKILKNIDDPNFPLIQLAYPKEIYKISLRKYERVQTYIPVRMEIQNKAHSEKLEGHILDLSIGGCLSQFANMKNLNLKLEDKIKISFSLPREPNKVIILQSVIRKIHILKDNIKIGMQFINVSNDIRVKINSLHQPVN